ncbi:longitudinals lacking protein, isoforms H/M/V-like isoform X6 [Drosophila miranda]|uniref:longitudinals lacking protein, isoforms H/M/V-like isoform X6 n=1 Tax=Drosophila miranda TaxID=7229 RepID=UPI00143F3D9F|nr:longitudinals lacking protein, isoforms H/M/V-like isoform X6 [Drosophila miranda]
MDDDQQFCLRWNNHQSTLISVFDTLLENETLVDCTLAAEGKILKAHKVVLSACSPYFATLLQEQYDKHPIFILKDVKYQELRAMLDYMYRGEVNISQDQLAALLKAAESLQIKGLSDNRTGGGSSAAAPKPESSQHHRGGKMSGAYTLEQTKRARLATGGAMDTSGDVSGSREGSSSPSRRRRKVRRRSLENDAQDNSNSSVLQAAASNQSILQQTSAGLAVSALVSTQMPGGGSNVAGTSQVPTQQQPLTSTNVTKKTESAKLTSSTAAPAHAATATAAGQQQQLLQQQTSDAINTENVQPQSQGAQGDVGDAEDMEEASAAAGGVTPAASGAGASAGAVHTGVVVKQLTAVVDKSSSNHKQKVKDNSVSPVGSEMVIEPKAEYDDDTHDENVEDLTLDEEDMTMEELDQTAGTSQGGEGSSQTYATWQHDRSQDELGLMAQDAQQRDPQDFGRLSPTNRSYSLMDLKTSPYTSPNETPMGVIKFEPSAGMDDHNEHDLRIDSGRATPTHCTGHQLVPKSQQRHGNGDNDDSNEEDNEPCDLRIDFAKVLLAAAKAGGGQYTHLHTPHSRPLPQLIYTAGTGQVARPDTPTHRYSSSSGGMISGSGADPSSSAAASIVAAATAAGLAANNTSASSTGGASTSAAAAAVAAAAAAAGGSGGNWNTSGSGGGVGAYACDRCGNTYARPHSLNRHVRFECGVEPKFECPICHKKSKHKHNLVLHMRTHQHR